jgi:hypothetical protein
MKGYLPEIQVFLVFYFDTEHTDGCILVKSFSNKIAGTPVSLRQNTKI